MKYVVALLNLIIIIWLFKRAAGNLKISSLNIISYVFYSILIFDFIGISIIYCGFNSHYLVRLISYNRDVINKSYWAMVIMMYLLPMSIRFFNNHVYKIKSINNKLISKKSEKLLETNKETSNKAFIICAIILFICLGTTIYVFYNIGYVPLFKFFVNNFDYAAERIKSGREFIGNVYIKNIIMLLLTPIVSYISYVYMRVKKEKKWIILFIISLILCVFVKTYDFSKSPIVYYFAYFLFIEIILGNVKNLKKVVPYVLGLFGLVVVLYITVANYKGDMLSFSSGPISRLTISQPGSLLLHFDAFPNKSPYLMGHSFPKVTKFVFGDGEYSVRSGRKVMEIYNSKGIDNGVAGVMSTVFIGEAYANFGWFGVVLSPIIVGFILSTVFCIYLKSKQSVTNICLYLMLIITYITIIQAGFVDFFYSISIICILLYFLIIKLIFDKDYLVKLKNRLFSKKIIDISNEKRMIFHIPNYLDSELKSGSKIRPLKMIQAFESNGYKVDTVTGYGKERQDKIDEIEENILNGIKYDFIYSESSTMPTLLTEKHHLPTHPCLDYSFFRFCKRHGIRIGLFYRDLYWKFEEYGKGMSSIKKKLAILLYKYDIFMYNRLVDVLYLPSLKMKDSIPNLSNKIKVKELPPGVVDNVKRETYKKLGLNIFYVGGITEPNGLYGLGDLMSLAKIDNRISVTICCREDEWKRVKKDYQDLLNKHIKIVHKSGKELDKYYKQADLCSLLFPYNEYRTFAMPIKLFEYISNGIPVIASDNTAVAEYIDDNKIGFVVKNNKKQVATLMKRIVSNKNILKEKREKIKKLIISETWEKRAEEVAKDLR